MAKKIPAVSKATTERELRVEPERANFRTLLASNANYFGNLVGTPLKAVKKIVGNTAYEQLGCIGYNPRLSYLEATVQIKRTSGYGGALCGAGSNEYVRFFVDYGTGWIDAGLVGVNVHDIPASRDCAGQPDHPLSYVLTLPIDPQRNSCRTPMLPRVRAILSWSVQPPAGAANVGWTPVWGNVVEQTIQIAPRISFVREVFEMVDLNATLKLPLELEIVKDFPIPLPDPPPFDIKTLAQMYAGAGAGAVASKKRLAASVEPHRFAAPELAGVLSEGALTHEALSFQSAAFKEAGLELAVVIDALAKTKGDVSYEELTCLGLDYNRDLLAATFVVKKPSGYSGSLCSAGSKEYVSFWADWDDNCEWSYVGTAAIPAHDIAGIPASGLWYTALMPVDLSQLRRPCSRPRVAKIRAVLSWATAPSTTDADAIPHWGNRLDTHVQIKPGEVVPIEARISIIGGIGVASIEIGTTGLTKPNAKFAMWDTFADPWNSARACPFGGSITLQAPPVAGHKYKLFVQNVTAGGPEIQLTQPVWVTDLNGVSSNHAAGVGGMFDYLPVTQNLGSMLYNRWVPGGDDLWRVRLELYTGGGVYVGTTAWHNIQVDNTAPSTVLVPPTVDIRIDSGGDCKDFTVGTTITGRFVARDQYFGAYALSTLPTSMSPNAPSPASGLVQTAASPGDAWSLNTAGMKPCGYVIQVQVWDRSIVNSVPGQHNYNRDDVGLCLRG